MQMQDREEKGGEEEEEEEEEEEQKEQNLERRRVGVGWELRTREGWCCRGEGGGYLWWCNWECRCTA